MGNLISHRYFLKFMTATIPPTPPCYATGTSSIIHKAVYSPRTGYADGIAKAVVIEDVEKFRGAAVSSPYWEDSQEDVPHEERDAEFKAGSGLHVQLPTVNDDHVSSDVVKAAHPVLLHPFSFLIIIKVLLEFEHVRVIGHCNGFHFGCCCAWSTATHSRVTLALIFAGHTYRWCMVNQKRGLCTERISTNPLSPCAAADKRSRRCWSQTSTSLAPHCQTSKHTRSLLLLLFRMYSTLNRLLFCTQNYFSILLIEWLSNNKKAVRNIDVPIVLI